MKHLLPLPGSARLLGLALGLSVAFTLAFTLGSGAASADAPKALEGCAYAPARAFAQKYCGSCHTSAGTHAQKKRAYAVLQLDTYEQWKADAKVVTAVLDKWHLDGKIMPPPKAQAQPTDAERRLVLDWLARGSPNTATGK